MLAAQQAGCDKKRFGRGGGGRGWRGGGRKDSTQARSQGEELDDLRVDGTDHQQAGLVISILCFPSVGGSFFYDVLVERHALRR